MADYQNTTDKHPMNKILVATRTGKIPLGNGRSMPVTKGDRIRVSEPYEGQASQPGERDQVLVQPVGGHSHFVLPTTVVNKHYRAERNSEDTNVGMREMRGRNDDPQTGGKRDGETIAGAGNPKKLKQAEKSQSEKPMDIAAGDNYDVENMAALAEKIETLDDNQIDELLETMSDQQIELLEAAVREKHKMKNKSKKYSNCEMQENYVGSALDQDVTSFEQSIRNSLDAHAHAAIEQMKNNMLEMQTQDEAEQVDESAQQLLEYIDSLDETQLEQYCNQLTEQQIEVVEQLLDERAKYGTKKGRHRLAMKIRKGQDVGKKGKHFEEIAAKAGQRYGSAERGRSVAAASMWKRLGGNK
jgi:hypothetical protein